MPGAVQVLFNIPRRVGFSSIATMRAEVMPAPGGVRLPLAHLIYMEFFNE
jgi:hypothetical protein